MKEIKETRTIVEVVGYEAYDGTRFADKAECEKYEKLTAEEAIINNFEKLIVKIAEEEDITKAEHADCEEFVGAGCGGGYGIALVRIKNEDDVNICNAYKKLVKPDYGKEFTNDMIGKEILVYIADEYYDDNKATGDWEYNTCWIYGTIEDQIALYTKRIREAFEVKSN